MSELILSPEQFKIVDQIYAWYLDATESPRTDNQFLTLGGYAGTGKTTIIRFFIEMINNDASCVAYTGKAASVLTTKLPKGMLATTIHRLIYAIYEETDPITNKRRMRFQRKDIATIKADCKSVLIIDEASMVNERIWKDLLSLKVPILAVGDHGQLPPIEGKFNLMETPQLKLETIHRQAEGNTIIDLAHAIRSGSNKNFGQYAPNVSFIEGEIALNNLLESPKVLNSIYNGKTIMLSWRNTTRKKYNLLIRERLGFKGTLIAGEKIIGLRNNYNTGVINGIVYNVEEVKQTLSRQVELRTPKGNLRKNAHIEEVLELTINDGSNISEVKAYAGQFGKHKTEYPSLWDKDEVDLMDYAYCLTTHKAQGSQADIAIVLVERGMSFAFDRDTYKRWLYTAITRASKHLIIVKL